MSVVINGNYANEVGTTNISAAQAEGLLLQEGDAGLLVPATTRIDAILLSEVVTETEFLNRYYIFKDVDFGPYTRIGESSSIAKGVHGLTALGLLVTAASAITAGTDLELAAGVLVPHTTGNIVAKTKAAIAQGATRTGLIHIL